MDYNSVKKYLGKYQILKADLIDYENRMTGLKAISYSVEEKASVRTDTTPISYYMDKIESIEKEMEEIRLFIENNLHGTYRLILWHRYIENEPYEKISTLINFSVAQVKRKHNHAIKEIVKKMSRNEPK